MIKSLLGEDENTEKKEEKKPNKKANLSLFGEDEDVSESEKKVSTPNFEAEKDIKQVERIETVDEIKAAIENPQNLPIEDSEVESQSQHNTETVKPFEIKRPIGQPQIDDETETVHSPIPHKPIYEEPIESSRTAELENKLREIEEELKREKELEEERRRQKKEEQRRIAELQNAEVKQVQPLDETETLVKPKQEQPQNQWADWDKEDQKKQAEEDSIVQVTPKAFDPNEQAKTFRNMGMAWSAAIALFGAVVIMLLMGWIADTLLGTTPWGIVVGIVIGAIIGFLQFFRTTSQIINPKPSDFEKVSLNTNIKVAEEKKDEEKDLETSLEKSDENLEEESQIEENIDEKSVEKSIDENALKTTEETEEILSEISPKEPVQEIIEDTENIDEKLSEIDEKTTDDDRI